MHADPWSPLKSSTSARIALGRAGGSLPTKECLSFAADHADARDAVYSALDLPALQQSLSLPLIALHSQAADRDTYLKRPDLGRCLNQASADQLRSITKKDEVDVAIIIADGLSATAAQRHAAAVVIPLLSSLKIKGFSLALLCAVQQARVAIEDEIGSLLHAGLAVILIGERPGLGTADSLGAYLVHDPAIGKTDADRNCISNIHPRHLPLAVAADSLLWLIEQSLIRKISGVSLKDDRVLAQQTTPLRVEDNPSTV
jgi:ethanolamine ammonia-lyase small subunit